MPRKKRQTAAEIFKESSPDALIPRVWKKFDEIYPDIEALTMTVEDATYNIPSGRKKSNYTKANFSQFVDCNNPLCHNGGVHVNLILAQMYRSREAELETEKLCPGNEASPKGGRIYRPCGRFYKISISVKYKSAGK